MLDRARQLRDERVEEPPLVVGDRRARPSASSCVARRPRSDTPRPRAARASGAAPPVVQVSPSRCQSVTPSSAKTRRIDSRSSATDDVPASRASVSASARARCPPRPAAPRARRTRSPSPRRCRKTASASRFSRLPDRERVERRREVPVDEQERRDGGAERRPDAADRGDDDDRRAGRGAGRSGGRGRRAAARGRPSAPGGATAARTPHRRRRGGAAARSADAAVGRPAAALAG